MTYPKLFSPIKIRDMEVDGRIVMSAMGTNMPSPAKLMTQQYIDFMVARAVGGVPLMFAEVTSVHLPSASDYSLKITEESDIPEHKRLTDKIHSQSGSKIGCQLWQGSMAVSGPVMMITPESASLELIAEVVESFGKAAARAAAAGYDCVEFHCAHTYLPHSFLSGGINHRTDEYGGSFENRVKFPLECIRAIRANIPDGMPLFMRVGAYDDYLEGGLTIEEVIRFCILAGKEGVDVLDISRGNFFSDALKFEVPPMDLPVGFNIDNAARIRRETGMITIGVGRINRASFAEKILEEGKVDMVVMARAQLADSEFCNKARTGRENEIRYCIGCNQGCYDHIYEKKVLTCTRNPALGREKEFTITKTTEPKTVLVAGGGMAGLEAALVLKQRGHNVVLHEMSNTLGGQFVLAGIAPNKEEIGMAVEDTVRMTKELGVEIHLNSTVTPEQIAATRPDAVIIATGAEPLIIPFEGVDLPHVTNSHDVLSGRVKPQGRVVIIGGGLVGVETAEYMAEKGMNVTIVEMKYEVAEDLGTIRRICVMERLDELGVTCIDNAMCKAIRPGFVEAERKGEAISVPCESVVLAVGVKSRPTDEFQAVCKELGIPHHVIGDAKSARKVIDAIAEGAVAGRAI